MNQPRKARKIAYFSMEIALESEIFSNVVFRILKRTLI
ncbi:putative uncharacterized protein [Waddlia chondrophila 2032/99]|nr:putative uncharacterized protein [Waddlia chondrophila 2032/99]